MEKKGVKVVIDAPSEMLAKIKQANEEAEERTPLPIDYFD